jgi:ubiquinone/menaquinone biosynthesis C-methylase UbiE
VGFYVERVLPRLTNAMLGSRSLGKFRARVASGLEGEVLEIGFGSGLNVPHYPAAVTRVLAVDPSALARDLAAERIAASSVPVDHVGLDGERLPLPDASVDHALTTWTLCSIPDVELALREIHRVLRPGGELHFIEHGLSPDATVARWQHRLTPIQRRVAGGCHLNRDVGRLIRQSPLEVVRLASYYLHRPRPYGYTYEGVAVKR